MKWSMYIIMAILVLMPVAAEYNVELSGLQLVEVDNSADAEDPSTMEATDDCTILYLKKNPRMSVDAAKKACAADPTLHDRLSGTSTRYKTAAQDEADIPEPEMKVPASVKVKSPSLAEQKAEQMKKAEMMHKEKKASENMQQTEAYQLLKDEFAKKQERAQDAQVAFDEAKKEAGSCVGECDVQEASAMKAAKSMIKSKIDLAISFLQKLSSRAAHAELDNEVEMINEDLKELSEFEDELRNAETKEDLQAVAQDVAATWKESKTHTKKVSTQVITGGVKNVIDSSVELEKTLSCALDALKENGVDVTALDVRLSEFSQRLETAQEKHELGNKYLQGAEEDEVIARARTLLAESKQELQHAQDILMGLVNKVKAEGLDLGTCEKEKRMLMRSESIESFDEDMKALQEEITLALEKSVGDALADALAKEVLYEVSQAGEVNKDKLLLAISTVALSVDEAMTTSAEDIEALKKQAQNKQKEIESVRYALDKWGLKAQRSFTWIDANGKTRQDTYDQNEARVFYKELRVQLDVLEEKIALGQLDLQNALHEENFDLVKAIVDAYN